MAPGSAGLPSIVTFGIAGESHVAERGMHIGFDVSQTGANKAGCGYFAHAMIEALLTVAPQHEYSLYPSFGDFYFDASMPRANPYPGSRSHYGPHHRTLEEARSFWTSPRLESALGRPDLVHANNFWCPAALATSRLVYTVYDLAFVAEPSWTTEVNRRGCWEGVSRAAANADWIVAISRASRTHFLETFPAFPAERVRVIHPCSRFADDAVKGARPASLAGIDPGGYWLSVGTIEPRKNQRRVVEAYARYLARGGERIPLVLAGGSGWLMEGFRGEVERLGLGAQVILTGYVSDAELAWLYRHCRANVYFSLFEGFGLPVLEGMQFGAPTIASDSTSIPEVAGEAALLLKPDDTEGLANALLVLAGDANERSRLSRAARAQAARFDWRASAAALAALYEEAASIPKREPTHALDPDPTDRRLMTYGRKLYERALRSLRRP